MGHLMLIRGHLHILGDGRDQFCPLIIVETGCGMQSTGRWFGSSVTATVVISGGASALGMAPTVVVAVVVGAPPSNKLAQEALVRRHDDDSLVGNGARSRVKFARGMALFIWETPSTRRGRRDDPDLSLIRAQTVMNPNEIERG
jgi:hypothetical protein